MKLQSFFDAAYVINLKRRGDRMAQFWGECDKIFFGARNDFVRRWDAFDNPTNGNSGCTRSHRELMAHIATSPFERVLIFEDDTALITKECLAAENFFPGSEVYDTHCRIMDGDGTLDERFDVISNHIPGDWDVIYLGGGYGEPPLKRVNPFIVQAGFMQTTSSIGVTRGFARRFTEKVGSNLEACPGAIDNLYGSFSRSNNFYVLQPRLCYQRKSKSDINGNTNSYLCNMTDVTHERMV